MKAGFNSQKQKRRFERETEAFLICFWNICLENETGNGRDKKLGSSIYYKYEKVFFFGYEIKSEKYPIKARENCNKKMFKQTIFSL